MNPRPILIGAGDVLENVDQSGNKDNDDSYVPDIIIQNIYF